MCFYSKLSKKAIEIENRFKASMEQRTLFQPSQMINAFSFPKTPVITDKMPDQILFYQWGLIPFWAKDTSIQKNTLNARIETLDVKPAFKAASHNRCLVIADGFYEWQWKDPLGKNKQKYLLSMPNDELFSFAGIYSDWIDTNSGEMMSTYSIVTTEACGIMEEIHNSKHRMPIVLSPEKEHDWLHGKDHKLFADTQISLKATAI